MNYDSIQIELEKQLRAELFDLFEGEVIQRIIQEGRIERDQNLYKALHDGTSFKISEALSPRLFRLCKEAQAALAFDEPVEYYVTNSSETNAYAVASQEEDDSHLVVLHSRLIELFDDEELKFVIGHELGHLISKNAQLRRILHFVYPSMERAPMLFQHKIRIWDRLAELTADRYGYLASPDMDKCVTNFFKLASGLETSKINFEPEAYLKEVDKLIEQFQEGGAANRLTHPINPIRIKALEYFSKSALSKALVEQREPLEDDELREQTAALVRMLSAVSDSELDLHRMHFMASAGLVAASVDEEIHDREINVVISVLGGTTIFPEAFLQQISDAENLSEIFVGSITAILEKNPSERYAMFNYILDVIMADRRLADQEIEFLFDTGEKLFQFPRAEVAQLVGQAIQARFVPMLVANRQNQPAPS